MVRDRGRGTALLVYGVRADRPALVAIALLAAASGRAGLPAWPAGLIAGYAFWVVVFGSAPGWLSYHAYRLVEAVVRLLGGLLGRLAATDATRASALAVVRGALRNEPGIAADYPLRVV